MCDITHLYVSDMTHSYVRHYWFTCVTWLIRICRHGLFICATWCHTYEYAISFTWLIYMSVTWSFILMTCLIHTCNMTHSYVKHESFVTWLCATQYMRMCDTTHSYVWHDSKHTGWQNLIGCLKLQVFFRKRATNYRALLQKMTYTDKASCDFRPPSISILGTSYELGWDTYVAVCCSV